MNIFKKAGISLALLLISILAGSLPGHAQLNPLSTQYFLNQYLANPAMAGIQEGVNMNLALRQQWSVVPGAPSSQALTADFKMNNKIGLGLNMFNETAGLIKSTRVMGTYSYHLPLDNEDDQVHFGVSLGFMNQRVSNEDINGDPNDAAVGRFNDREIYIDGDFGFAYTSSRMTLQAALPNLKSFFGSDENDIIDRSTFYSAASYKWKFGEGGMAGIVEPKVVYRGVKGYDNLVDAGANLTMLNNQLTFTGMYHSSKSATFGLGFNYHSMFIQGMYTTETAALQGYTNGDFEVGLKYRYTKKEK
jgi:type IX secretion system PorP/SprF family membrane protein